MKVVALDISSTSTGWSVFSDGDLVSWGLLELPNNLTHPAKLSLFRINLKSLLLKHNPGEIVIEDVFSGPNPKVQKVLSLYHGVAYQLAWELLNIAPIVLTESKVRSKVGKANGVKLTGKGAKQKTFDWIVHTYALAGFSFAAHNDITDAIAAGLAYWL